MTIIISTQKCKETKITSHCRIEKVQNQKNQLKCRQQMEQGLSEGVDSNEINEIWRTLEETITKT